MFFEMFTVTGLYYSIYKTDLFTYYLLHSLLYIQIAVEEAEFKVKGKWIT